MEVPGGHNNKLMVCAYELFCTSGLVYAVLSSGGDKLAASFTVFALILMSDKITGAHFNPAVSTGVLFANKNIGQNLCFYLMIIIS